MRQDTEVMGEVSADDEIVGAKATLCQVRRLPQVGASGVGSPSMQCIFAEATMNRGCPTPEQNQFTVDFPLVDVYVELSTVSWNVTYG